MGIVMIIIGSHIAIGLGYIESPHFLCAIFRAVLSFSTSRYFVSTEPLYRSALHYSLFLASRIIFRNFTIVYFLHKLISLKFR